MRIEKLSISSITPANYNPRKISPDELNKLRNSIQKFGYVEPIIYNKRTGKIVGGHQRFKILKEILAPEELVDVVIVDLDENEEKTLNVALNRIGGEWDDNKLSELLKNIHDNEEDLLEFTGFNDKEIELLLNQLEYEDISKEERFFSINREDIKESKIKTGDIVVLNDKHKIICGDSSDSSIFKKLFVNRKFDLMVTSPPYNVNIAYGKYKDNKKWNEYIDLIKKIFDNSKQFLNDYRFLCINIGDMTKNNLSAHYSIILENLDYKYCKTIYWVKPSASARGTNVLKTPYPRWYRPKVNTETILVYEFGEKEPEIANVMLTYSKGELTSKTKPDKGEAQVISKRLLKQFLTNVWYMQPETTLSRDHPAPYPVQLPLNCLKFFSLENERVFDPFTGSGTSLLAADLLGREFYGIELDPKYVQLVIERYKRYKPESKIEIIKNEN